MGATLIGERFDPGSFDLIVSTLLFSELPPDTQQYVLAACTGLLAENGRLLIADEVVPDGRLARLLFFLIRLPLALITWLLTRTTTAALVDFEAYLADAGFHARRAESHLGGSLVLFTQVGVSLFPKAEKPQLLVNIELPESSSFYATQELATRIDRQVDRKSVV